jgi:hypothetical protein
LPLTAIRAATQEIVEAFDITPERWEEMQKEPIGAYLVRRSGLPAILKKNLAGTQWFSARPGETDPAWKPTSVEHEFAQVQLAKALRLIGIHARIEEPGYTPTGERWEADIFLNTLTARLRSRCSSRNKQWMSTSDVQKNISIWR